ncbi:MAG: metallophosphoesterase family protein [Armatimonadota bacterium]
MRTLRSALLALALLTIASGCLAQPPAAPETPSFTFAVFGDCRPGNAEYSPILQAFAAEVGGLDVPFVIGTGDYIEGSTNQSTVRRQWEGFFAGLAPLQARRAIPLALAPGNHDIAGVRRNAEIFIEHFKRLYFSFDYEGCHFIILNSETVGSEGRLSDTQLAWLKQDLAESRDAKLTFVALHRPLFPVDGHVGSSMDAHPSERDALHHLFVEGGVDCVFAGHEHLYNHQERDGIHYFITGGAGAPLYAEPARGGFYHYLLVSVADEDFTVEVQRIAP